MKILRFIISVISVSLLTMTGLNGQSFMRYKMNNGTYNGFYTNAVDSIAHVTENGTVVQKVYSGEMVRTILDVITNRERIAAFLLCGHME